MTTATADRDVSSSRCSELDRAVRRHIEVVDAAICGLEGAKHRGDCGDAAESQQPCFADANARVESADDIAAFRGLLQ